ncbi:acetyl-CoA synthetase-like protein [Karstenula rhodostoma CBS 690.94]|uniref:Acetyl-CoA synthetase-like protein n=1 Tax=Karstenula rhodostoma CBS 690.94 TaxID=1392251 RepID=A0A9P4UJ17_9PLEO|nr:acetyl-CoA synthetase-like protein [Karstenula rhodostoma CBS 690.94]
MGSMSVDNKYGTSLAVDLDVYCAAWAVVLARHAGVEDACEVAFACPNGSSLRLSFHAGTNVDSFLQHAKKASDNIYCPFSTSGLPKVALKTAAGDKHTLDGAPEILDAHFQQAVLQLQSQPPSTELGAIDIASPLDVQHLLRWNVEPPPRVEETLCSLFLRQARAQPNAPAVSSWDGDLTYAQLNDLSARLTDFIRRQGVGRQQVVALCFDKSRVAVIAMLAVLRAGAAFVNLGIALPQQRQAAILSASDAAILLVDPSNNDRVNEHDTIPSLVVDYEVIAALPIPTTPLPEVVPTDAAAITFTSGSTGTPKGIVVEHGSIATTCEAMASRLDLGPTSRVLQFASYTFDASVGDIFYALSRGACVCSPSERERVDDLAAVARKLEVNWAFLTPSVLSLIEPRDVPTLRRLLVGGEKPDPKHIALWAESVSLHLVMGPAECAIYCAASEEIRPGQDTSTFGRAAGCRLWVVDQYDHSKLAPVGCQGELIVEGRSVARGYLNDHQRTRLAFLDAKDVPWLPPQHESRLYKSGDIVRFNDEDGTYSFVARKDNQVKLHGQRVELSEIEIHLKKIIPDVDSALVLLNTSAEQAQRHPLVSFLVFAGDSPAVVHTGVPMSSWSTYGKDLLRKAKDQLAAVLPAYMIPTLFVPLFHVPFTANGKRDTAKLRHISQELSHDQLRNFSLSDETEVVSRPLSQREEQLRELWTQVLHVSPSELGSSSSFLEQGGDSLAAMHLVSAAIRAGLHLQVATVLMQPRLADMASKVRPLQSQTPAEDATPAPLSLLPPGLDVLQLKAHCASACTIDVDQIEEIYPVTSLQEVLWTGSQRRPGTYILQMTFQLPSSVPLDTFTSAWDQVIQTADVLRTRFVSEPHAGLLQVVTRTFSWDSYKDVDEFHKLNPYATMGLGDRLARLAIIKTGKTPTFVFAAHHVLYDAFMLNMIFVRIAEICNTGGTTALSPFKNYVAYTNRLPSTPSMSFWKSVLEDCPGPTWPRPSPADIKTTAIIRHCIAFSVRPAEFTIATIAQAAFTYVFNAHTHAHDVVFSMTFSGRDADLPSILDTAGPTLYTVPFRMRTDREITIRTFLDRVWSYIRDSAPYGHIGLPAIARASPDAARACDIRCVFSVQPQHVVAPEEVFGPRVSFREEMGRLPLIFECFVVPGGVEVVAEYNTGSLEGKEVQRFVERFGEVLVRLVGMGMEEKVSGIESSSGTDTD